ADQLRKLLDSHTRWHEIEKLAERAPVEFARSLWPAVRDIATGAGALSSDYVIRYADDRIGLVRLDPREYVEFDSPDQFLLAFDSALRDFARTRPGEFLSFVAEAGNPDSRLLQRLMCRGMRQIAPTYSAAALTFLMADPRRCWLGGL